MTSPAAEKVPTAAKPSFLDRPVQRGILKKLLAAVEPMKPGDIEAVVAIHEREIPEGVFTELGRDFLTLFYRQIISSRQGRGYVFRKDGKIVAYIAGSSDAGGFFKQLFARYFFQTLFIVLQRIMAQPSFLPRFLQRVFMNRNKEKCAESLAGAVLKEYQGRGYGLILLKKLIDDLRETGAGRIQCDVVRVTDSPAAVRLHAMYQKGGYEQAGAFRVGPVEYIRYRRYL